MVGIRAARQVGRCVHAAGDPLFAGTLNQNGELQYRVTASASHSTLARIIKAVHEAQSTRAPTQRFIDAFARIYTPAVFALAIGLAILPPLATGADWLTWAYRALVLLVIACPCALVLSTPISVVSGMTAAARRGILVKGGLYMEQAYRLKVLALDKTGTLTQGKAMEAWRDAFAQVGIYVFKDAFHTKTYFGFCLYDDEFPIIYVNNSCPKSRQIFTLFHELGHLLFHTSGIDVLDDDFIKHLPENEQKIEVICNGLAARLLVPDDVFDKLLKSRKADRDTAAELAAYFSVSREVIYRKLLDRNPIDAAEYSAAAKLWESQVKPAKESSGNFYNSRYAYLGSRYIDLAFTRYYQQRFDELQLADYLNLKPKNLQTFAEKFAGGGL